MKFADAIDQYIADMRNAGRINSPRTEREYRGTLDAHCDDLHNRDPSYVGRNDVKTTLTRWANPNTQRKNRSILVSFYDWAMEEGIRKDNPARQTRRPKRKPTRIYRMTRAEAAAFLDAAITTREKRIAYLGVCAGMRNAELRGLQGRHFARPGWIWVSEDIGKGARERWIPVLEELEPIVDDIRSSVGLDEYVIPAQRWRNPGMNSFRGELTRRQSSSQALRTAVMEIARRAGIPAHIHPHLMRHAFGDHIARYAGIKNAQALLGHADVGTTQNYTGAPTLDELASAIRGMRFGQNGTPVLPPGADLRIAGEAPTGIEPVDAASRAVERNSVETLARVLRAHRLAFEALA